MIELRINLTDHVNILILLYFFYCWIGLKSRPNSQVVITCLQFHIFKLALVLFVCLFDTTLSKLDKKR